MVPEAHVENKVMVVIHLFSVLKYVEESLDKHIMWIYNVNDSTMFA